MNPNARLYRLSTQWNAFKALYHLSPVQVENFLKAYEIYACDWVDGQAMKDSQPIEYQKVKESLLDWYGVLNHLCAIGEVEKMYIPPTLNPSESVINNQILFEKMIATHLDMKKNDKIFEPGCGKGRVASHLASLTGANITGINIDQGQLDNASAFVKKNNLAAQCQFINADFNDLPFQYPDNYFDGIYEIQALSLCRDLNKLFGELHRMLKPGGKFSLLEWVSLPAFDANNSVHMNLMKKIKPLIGAIGTPTPAEYEKALQEAGFTVLLSKDPSINQSQIPLITKAGSYFDKLFPFMKMLVKLKILPKHFITLFTQLGKDTDALCEADNLRLVTMSYHIVAQK